MTEIWDGLAALRLEQATAATTVFRGTRREDRTYAGFDYSFVRRAAGMTDDASIHVQLIAKAADLAPLRAGWNRLAGGVPFRSFDWLEGWWQAYGAGPRQELFVLAAFDAQQQLAGLAPWYLDCSASQRGVIRYLGSGEVCSDYLTVLCRRGREEEITRAMADWLCAAPATESWRLLELGNAYRDDLAIVWLLRHLVARGNFVHRHERSSCWRISLPPSWDEYLASLSKSHRKQIRRLERNYFYSGRARLRTIDNPTDLADGLETLALLHQRRRRSLGDRGRFASDRFATFHRETAGRLLSSGNLRLALLELDGRTVAAEYQVLGDGVVYAYQSGIEPQALAHEPGRLIMTATLQQAIAEGRHAFDFLRGDELYKIHWRARPRPTQDIRVFADTPAARLRHNLWLAGDNVKSWIKRSLQFSGVMARTHEAPAPRSN